MSNKSLLRAAVGFVLLSSVPLLATAATGDPRSERVRLDDLNLATRAGSETLYRRITAAADAVCHDFAGNNLSDMQRLKKCKDDAIGNAVGQVNHPGLTAYYSEHHYGKLPPLVSRAAGPQTNGQLLVSR